MELSKRERRKLRSSSSNYVAKDEIQSSNPKKSNLQSKPTTKKKYYVAISLIGLIIVVIIAYSVYSASRPGPYDDFAKCLTKKGAVMYGAMDWCHFTQGQKAMFGKSFKYINYHEYTELPGIKKTPTWVIDSKWYENAQAFDKLAALTGCKL